MATYRKVVITNQGKNMLARAMNGETLTWTYTRIGSGSYTPSEDLTGKTELKNPKGTFQVSSAAVDGLTMQVNSIITNEGVTIGFDMTEIGIFARMGSSTNAGFDSSLDKLVALVVAIVPDTIPAASDVPLQIINQVQIRPENVDQISFTWNSLNPQAFATIADFATMRLAVESQIESLIGDEYDLAHKTWRVTLPVTGWTDTYPYTQTVSLADMVPEYDPLWSIDYSEASTQDESEILDMIRLRSVTPGTNQVTVTMSALPAVDFVLVGKGY